jgi:hypothetical protein
MKTKYRVEFPYLCYGETCFVFDSMADASDFVDMVWDCCVTAKEEDKVAHIMKVVEAEHDTD